jgi:hydroxypyruvate isomerase
MFDCYHVGRTEGDLITRLQDLQSVIGHIQFASVPERAAPDSGEIDYRSVFKAIASMGWDAPLGAEYKPGSDTDATLEWMQTLDYRV